MQPAHTARIHVVGSVNEDLVLRVPRLPRPGETVLARSSSVSAGGKGANQAVAAARTGAAVALVARVGDDDAGDRMRAALSGAGVDVRSVRTDPVAPTGRATVTVSGDGENAIVVAAGANDTLSPDEVTVALASLEPGDVVVAQAEIPEDAVACAATAAARAGARCVLNLAPYRALAPGTCTAATVLVVNVAEAEALAAAVGSPPARAADLAARLGCGVVITRGADGVDVAAPGGPDVRLPALEVGDPVDTTGAGDAFVGVLAAGLADGVSLRSAAHRACVAAGLSVRTPGAQPSFPDRVRIDAAAGDTPVPASGPVA